MFKIGDITLSSPIILAPMAGITDLPFRMVCRSFGCELAYTEMISAQALVYRNQTTLDMLSTTENDRPLGVQLLGNDPEVLVNALEVLRTYKFDVLDLNAACPVKKVTNKGEGAGLLREPHKLGSLLKALVENAGVPVTVKIRAGWDEASVNAKDAALYAQEAGISALFIHGRTREQKYSGRVDYRIIAEVKKALKIPVIASGDAFSPQLVKKMFDETGCDAVAIARGALGNPWIFRETTEYLSEGTIPRRPGVGEIADIAIAHLDSCITFHGEVSGIMLFRKLFSWYARGVPGVKSLKEEAFHATTKEQMACLIEKLRDAQI